MHDVLDQRLNAELRDVLCSARNNTLDAETHPEIYGCTVLWDKGLKWSLA